ncbi:hypothetical protein WOC76_21375 [Methylocystis sp. IM3]|uniref:hypothetical protein n=1 Tax=unclassified Methylocystis TaxID=2625913 RepID=UPI0030F7FB99
MGQDEQILAAIPTRALLKERQPFDQINHYPWRTHAPGENSYRKDNCCSEEKSGLFKDKEDEVAVISDNLRSKCFIVSRDAYVVKRRADLRRA